MKNNNNIKPIEILLVEDNDGDILLTKRALQKSKLSNNLHVVKDGTEALAFLRNKGKYKNAVRPDLILLDLNLPMKNGQEVLSDIKKDDKLKRIPVVVLTTSSRDEDIRKSYDLHANCYITKPLNMDQFISVVNSIDDFWFSIVKLPN
jgi:CheY-like chemotaxis protein